MSRRRKSHRRRRPRHLRLRLFGPRRHARRLRGLSHVRPGVGGEISTSGPLVEEMMREVAEDVTGAIVPRTAHWIPEENPGALVRLLIEHAG